MHSINCFTYTIQKQNIIDNLLLTIRIKKKNLYQNTVNLTISGHRQFRITFRKTLLFSTNDTIFQYFDYPVIFPNHLSALNMILAVETCLIEVVTYYIHICRTFTNDQYLKSFFILSNFFMTYLLII